MYVQDLFCAIPLYACGASSKVQHTLSHYNTLQHTATNCNTPQHTVLHTKKLHAIFNLCEATGIFFPLEVWT